MGDFWKEREKKKINKKKITIAIILLILIVVFAVTSIIYINNKDARGWIDKNILQKEKTQNNLPSIEIEDSDNSSYYAFNKYIGILNKNNFQIYDNTGKKTNELTLEITKPIFASNGRYLVVKKEKGRKLYVIADKDIIWEKDVEGNISQVCVNRNGYVAVNIVDTSYKTVTELYDGQGEFKFKAVSMSRVIASTISDNNKYLALAEVDTTGTMIQSNIKIISIDDGINDAANSVKKIYNGENNELITNIKYQEKNKLVCMYTDKIKVIKTDETTENLQEYGDKKVSFASIDLANSSITIEEKSSGLFTADSIVNIVNSDNKGVSLYTAESVTKEIYTSNNIIALNLGSEVEFINTNGWLVKKYIAEQEITSIIISDTVAGIVYRDKIEIINL